MGLVLGHKTIPFLDSVQTAPQKTETAFREIHRWARKFEWRNLTPATGWAVNGLFQIGLDPFDFWHLRGSVTLTGTLPANSVICNIPTDSANPQDNPLYIIGCTTTSGPDIAAVQVGAGALTIVPNGSSIAAFCTVQLGHLIWTEF